MLSLTWLSQPVGVRTDALMAMAVGVSLGCQRTQARRSCCEIALRSFVALRLLDATCAAGLYVSSPGGHTRHDRPERPARSS